MFQNKIWRETEILGYKNKNDLRTILKGENQGSFPTIKTSRAAP